MADITDKELLLTKPRMGQKSSGPGLFSFLNINRGVLLDATDSRAPLIDISNYQPNISWPQVGQNISQLAGIFIKSTESVAYFSPSYYSQWDGSGALGIPHAAYHFWRGNTDGRTQALWFLSKTNKGELPPVLDVEDSYNVPQGLTDSQKASYGANIKLWLDTVQNAWQQTPIIYTGKWFWDRLGMFTWAKNYPGWFAHYKPLDNIGPLLPIGWTTYTFWQWCSTTNVNGITGFVDADVFNGTRTEFMTWAGLRAQITDHQAIMILRTGHPSLFPNG